MEKNQHRAIQYALIAVLLWSTVATAFKLALSSMSPMQLLTIASVSSFTILFVVILLTKRQQEFLIILKTKWKRFALFSLLNPVAYYLVLFSAYDRLPASQAQPLNYTWAIALTLMSAIFLGQKIRVKDWLACGLGYLGVLVIATKGQLLDLTFTDGIGVALALISTFLWASYWILNTKIKTDPIISVCLCFLFGTIWLVPLTQYLYGFNDITSTSILAAVYVGVFEMGVTFVFWLMAMRYAENTSMISNLIFISPFISLLLLHFIVGEEIFISTVLGLLFIVIGLLIQNVKKKQH